MFRKVVEKMDIDNKFHLNKIALLIILFINNLKKAVFIRR
jgi:hypothetical protein